MTAGKATGAARGYQELCRDVLQRRFGGRPYSGDGIDVAFEAAGTTWTIDVALIGGGIYEGKIVLAECRQTARPQQQGNIAAFALEAEKIREATGQPVAAFFMVSTDPQLGAVKLETQELELGGVVRVSGAQLPDTEVAFLHYDRERKKKIHNYLMFIERAAYQVQVGTVTMTVTRADGTVEPPIVVGPDKPTH